MKCFHPFKDKVGNSFPCGQCMPCKINRTRDWTIRLLHEYHAHNCNGLFITLTYDNEHLPIGRTLVKADLQKFFKRLRKQLDKECRKIKYFACGEYGSIRGRPHYHAIVFGLTPNDKKLIWSCWKYADWQLLNLSPKGRKSIGTVTADSCRYVTGYIQKKLYGKDSEYYKALGLLPPFQLSSQGLGLSYVYEHYNDILDNVGVPYKGSIAPIPRYYKKKMFPSIHDQRVTFSYIYEDMIEFMKSEEYENNNEIFKIGWKQGLRGKYLKEFITEEKTTIENMDIKFKLSINGDKIE